MGADALEQRVIALVARCTTYDPSLLTLDTQINNHLGVAGDDAVELIMAFEREFGVRTDDESFHDVFRPEVVGIRPLVRWILRKPAPRYRSFTVRHLVEAARSGFLSMPNRSKQL